MTAGICERVGVRSSWAIANRCWLRFFGVLVAFGAGALANATEPATKTTSDGSPNVILILADDLGYGDLGCFGAADIQTPNIDQLAREGVRFTDFYVSQPVCTASRASLMTGCYAQRVGLAGALNHSSENGIASDELLLSEVFKARGYATAAFGKWHLGTRPQFNPIRHGFDRFGGIPYSNDNSRYHPIIKGIPPLPWLDGERVAELDPDQSRFTRRITDEAIKFVESHRDQRFFLYLPHIMPHVPIFASSEYRGKSRRGIYGDVVEELDASVGELLACLRRCDLERRTLVIFLSDNGPFLSYGDHAGSNGGLREGKLTTFEGGVRVPCVMRWPGVTRAGTVCREMASAMDLWPTLRSLVDGPSPTRRIDGRDIGALIRGEKDAKTPHEALYFFEGQQLQAVRHGRWKLHLPHSYLTVAGAPGRGGKPANFENLRPESIEQSGIRGIASRHGYEVREIPWSLFDLQVDPGETTNLASEKPDVMEQMRRLVSLAPVD